MSFVGALRLSDRSSNQPLDMVEAGARYNQTGTFEL